MTYDFMPGLKLEVSDFEFYTFSPHSLFISGIYKNMYITTWEINIEMLNIY